MLKFATLILAAATILTATARAEPLVRHAGEWETTIDNRKPSVVCFPTDTTLDQAYVMQKMAKIPNAKCAVSDIKTVGSVASYSLQCTIGGGLMTSSGTITQTGPDAYSSKEHSHGGVIAMPDGKSFAMPDTDMVTVSHRLGPCKPGDRQVTH
jgi:uncharacterized protein DUF3617